jgi:hypothetical protein
VLPAYSNLYLRPAGHLNILIALIDRWWIEILHVDRIKIVLIEIAAAPATLVTHHQGLVKTCPPLVLRGWTALATIIARSEEHHTNAHLPQTIIKRIGTEGKTQLVLLLLALAPTSLEDTTPLKAVLGRVSLYNHLMVSMAVLISPSLHARPLNKIPITDV